jgi:hypothetical protein
LGKTKQLDILDLDSDLDLDLDDSGLEDNDFLLTYYVIILNQIYIVNGKNISCKIIFDKIILIPEKYKVLPIFIIWCKNNTYFLKIYDARSENLKISKANT